MPRQRSLLLTAGFCAGLSLILVLKVFLIKGCWAFDVADDANHTFPNLFVARQALRAGVVPEINFFNNFGSPLLGDALTYPFALHSATYWVFDGPVAMTINRFLFAALTLFLGFSYFRRRVSYRSSLVCTALVFFSAVSLWFFATYHMQLALFFEFALLLCTERIKTDRLKGLFSTYLISVMMILSLSINLSVFVLALVFGSQLIRDRFRVGRGSVGLALAFACAVISTWFQTRAFIDGIRLSSRLGAHYDDRGAYGVSTLVKRLTQFVPATHLKWHTDATVYLSIPVLALTLLGILILYRKKSPELLGVILLGAVPIFASYALMAMPSVWWSIPLLKSTDLTRVVWLALPFLMVALGQSIQTLSDVSRKYRTLVFAGLCLILFAGQIQPVIRILGLGDRKICRNTHHYSLADEAKLRPPLIAGKIERFSRFTVEEPTVIGNDLRGAYDQILGSYQRAITSDQRLLSYLSSKDLIEIEPDPNQTYHFKGPWRADELARLGIRYVALPKPIENIGDDWAFGGETDGKFIYENKRRPSPVYIREGDRLKPVRNLTFGPSQIKIELPSSDVPSTVVATFMHSSAYTARVDSREVEVRAAPVIPFVEVAVPARAKLLVLSYGGTSWGNLLLYVLAGLMFLATGSVFLRRMN